MSWRKVFITWSSTYRSSGSVVASTAPAPVSPVVAPVPVVPGKISNYDVWFYGVPCTDPILWLPLYPLL